MDNEQNKFSGLSQSKLVECRELNEHYRCEYAETTKRLHNTLKTFSSILVAISGLLAGVISIFIPACTCNNYEVTTCSLVLFLLSLTCILATFVTDILGILPVKGIENGFLLGGHAVKEIDEKELNCQYVEGSIDFCAVYVSKIKEINKINRKKNRLLIMTIICLALSIAFSSISLIVFFV